MKGKLRWLAPLFAGLVFAGLALAACGGGGETTSESSSTSAEKGTTSESTTAATSEPIKMGLSSYYNAADPYTQAWEDGMKCYAEKNGDSVITTYAELDVNKQITDVQTLMAQGVKGVFLYPLDVNALTPTFLKAEQSGVSVLSMNGPAPGAVNFDTNDNRQALGAETVQLVREVIPSGGKAVIIGGPPQTLAVKEQILGFTKAAEKAGIEILGRIDGNVSQAQEDQGQVVGNALLTKYPEANIIYALTAEQAHGAALAAQSHGKTVNDEFAVVGSSISPSAIEDIEAERITGVADDDAWQFGYDAAEQIQRSAEGEEVVAPSPNVKTYSKANAGGWVEPEDRCDSQG